MNARESVGIAETIAAKTSTNTTGQFYQSHIFGDQHLHGFRDPPPAKIRVENLNYELTEDDIYVRFILLLHSA